MGNWLETIDAMSSDLSVKQALYSKQSQTTRFTDDIEYEEMVSLHATNNWSIDSPEYSCGISETYLQRGAVVYGVSNTASVMLSSSWDSCKQLDRVNNNIAQSLLTKVYHAGTDAPYTQSTHSFYNGASSGMEALIGHSDDIETLDGSELEALDYIATAFDNNEDYGASSWSRVMNEYTDNGEQIMSTHDSDDTYTISTYYQNGTHSKQCGTWSSGGSDLIDCTN